MCGMLGSVGRGGGGVGSGRPDSGEAMTVVVRPQIRERNALPAIYAGFRPAQKIYHAASRTLPRRTLPLLPKSLLTEFELSVAARGRRTPAKHRQSSRRCFTRSSSLITVGLTNWGIWGLGVQHAPVTRRSLTAAVFRC